MDQGLKERLIGAAVLVALGVWLIPWLLDGPADPAEARKPALELPVPDGEAADAELKTEVIDLAAPRPPSPAGVSGAGASSGSASAASAPAKQGAAAQQTAAQQAANELGGVDAEVAELEAAKLDAAKTADASTPEVSTAKAAAEADRAKVASAEAEAAKAAKAAAVKAEAAKAAKAANAAKGSNAGIAAPAAKGDWAIQLGSFGDKGNAERLASRVAAFGVKPRITTFRADGRLMYRVRLGPYETRAKADAAASGLGAHGFVAQVVTAG